MPEIPFDLARYLDRTLRDPASRIFPDAFSPDVKPADPRFGDFQANGVLPYARAQRANPRETARRLLDAAIASGSWDPGWVNADIAGPGFINFKFTGGFLLEWLQKFRTESDLRTAAAELRTNRRAVVDYSAPNTAKQMHVGHIRSTVIGEAIARMLEFSGVSVIRDNHIGDWGTQFGRLIMAIKETGADLENLGPDPLDALEALYRKGTAFAAEDPDRQEQARRELVLLQNGDPASMAIWKQVCEVSYASAQEIYDLLGIHFDCVHGESFYRDRLDPVYGELIEHGIAREDEGALVVFHPEHPRFARQPFIIRKRDGASNYASTDLATVLYRVEELHAEAIVYVVGAPQSDHFEQLFLTVEKWFCATGRPHPELRHLSFGTILGEGGKAIRTRSGEPVQLRALLAEAMERAYALVSEKNPALTDSERREIARVVGIGAVRYCDLAQNRTSDYLFSWERMLSLEGNTAPYLLYAVARIHSIFRKANTAPGEGEESATPFETGPEIALARKLLQFPAVLDQALADLRPHLLCTYLFELSGAFSTFYSSDRVIGEDPPVEARRLLLCARTLSHLETGMHMLGLETLERM